MDPLAELTADHALFTNQIQSIVAPFYEDERPLQGLAGLLDWRFQGAISQYVLAEAAAGNDGECVYFPLTRNNQPYSILLVGGGRLASHKTRGLLPAVSWQALRRNLISLKLQNVGLSLQDFGSMPAHELRKNLEGVSLCLLK